MKTSGWFWKSNPSLAEKKACGRRSKVTTPSLFEDTKEATKEDVDVGNAPTH